METTPAVKLIEVSPRDGLQNEPISVPTRLKINFIHQLIVAGHNYIEATSFVSPKSVPQLADHQEVLKELSVQNEFSPIHFSVIVPNQQGLTRALQQGAREIVIFTSPSEFFCQTNLHCSKAESVQRFIPIVAQARAQKVMVRAYISCIVSCPEVDTMDPAPVAELANQLIDMGCSEICLSDTTGVATPNQITTLLEFIQRTIDLRFIGLHCRDTYGQAMANIYAGLIAGVRIFHSAVAGLGRCPYTRGAAGNVATEDLIYLLEGLGYKTGIDMARLIAAGQFITHLLRCPNYSKVALAYTTQAYQPS
jgi:hydroxymethylglutaryl-CoA lyase